MRELVISRLVSMIQEDPEYGIPREFDCDEDDYLTDPSELATMTDEELLDMYDACVGFNG